MDIFQVISSIWPLILSALFIWVLNFLITYYSNSIKGYGAEFMVSRRLNELNPKEYKVINNLMLPSNGNTSNTQIDHVVISRHGIFCIETKNYSGKIYGNTFQKEWSQYLSGKEYKFFNPTHQNYGHIKSVENIIKPLFPLITIFGFVVFPKDTKLKISGQYAERIGYTTDMLNFINNTNLQSLTNEDLDKIVDTLNKANISDKKLRKEHDVSIRAIKSGNPSSNIVH